MSIAKAIPHKDRLTALYGIALRGFDIWEDKTNFSETAQIPCLSPAIQIFKKENHYEKNCDHRRRSRWSDGCL